MTLQGLGLGAGEEAATLTVKAQPVRLKKIRRVVMPWKQGRLVLQWGEINHVRRC